MSFPCLQSFSVGKGLSLRWLNEWAEWRARRNGKRGGVAQVAGGSEAEKFPSSYLFDTIPTCPRKAHKAQLKGKKVKTKGVSLKGLILASGGQRKEKKDFFCEFKYFWLAEMFCKGGSWAPLSCPHLARQHKPANKFNSSFDFPASFFLCPSPIVFGVSCSARL